MLGLISTVVTGIGGGAIAVQYFRLQEWVGSVTGAGRLDRRLRPARLSDRAPGLQLHRDNRDAGIDEVAKEMRELR